MYYPDTESSVMPGGLVYEKMPSGKYLVMIRKNIRQETKASAENPSETYRQYVYDEVQFETDESKAYVEAHLDDLYRMHSGTTPTYEDRLRALEKAVAEIGGLL